MEYLALSADIQALKAHLPSLPKGTDDNSQTVEEPDASKGARPVLKPSGGGDLWGETIGTVMNVSNVSLEGVFRRFLRFNGERRNGLRNVSDVSRSRGFSIRR